MLSIFKKHKKNKEIEEQLLILNNTVSAQITYFENMKTYTKYNAGYKNGVIDAMTSIDWQIKDMLQEVSNAK